MTEFEKEVIEDFNSWLWKNAKVSPDKLTEETREQLLKKFWDERLTEGYSPTLLVE